MRKQEQKGKITALYERLSHDDGRSDESVSVENQKRILEDYARKNGFTNVRHFTDDGVRGTTFKRPGLDAMVDEIRAGNVATVIVKDQSRIGRDVVEVGLLKRTFDEYNVRFIAANDNLDTANGFDIMSIFRDVINELDNLCNLAKSDVNFDTEEVFKLEVTSFMKGLQKHTIRYPKGKTKEVKELEADIKSRLSNDRNVNIALLLDLLQNEIDGK